MKKFLAAIAVFSLIFGIFSALRENDKKTADNTDNMTSASAVSDIERTTSATTRRTTAAAETTTVLSYKISGAVPESATAETGYFDDVVFVGDSVSEMLKYYESANNRLGKAQFLTSVSLSAENALWDIRNKYSVHPKYNGQKMRIEDSVHLSKAKKIYIMLGMNDIQHGDGEKAVRNYEKLCNLIIEKSPYIKLYVQSVTPMIDLGERKIGRLNNKSIKEFNQRLCELCSNRGWYFINVAEVMYNEKGFLYDDYCSDPSALGIHLSNKGCSAWVDYLYSHTAEYPDEPQTSEITEAEISSATAPADEVQETPAESSVPESTVYSEVSDISEE